MLKNLQGGLISSKPGINWRFYDKILARYTSSDSAWAFIPPLCGLALRLHNGLSAPETQSVAVAMFAIAPRVHLGVLTLRALRGCDTGLRSLTMHPELGVCALSSVGTQRGIFAKPGCSHRHEMP